MRSYSAGVALLTLLALAAAPACQPRAEETAPPAAEVAPEEQQAIPPEQIYGATALENLRLLTIEIEAPRLPAGWDGARIATISDLQLGLWEDNERVAGRALEMALEADPDLVVLLGDYLAVGGEAEALRRVLAPLRERRTLAVLGDRDVRSDSVRDLVVQVLTDQGVRVLRTEREPLVLRGDTGYVIGLAPSFLFFDEVRQATILDTLAIGPTTLLLSHFPGVVRRAPPNRYPLALAGHTFCGQLEVPGTPQLAELHAEALQPFEIRGFERLYRVRGNTLFVTCGVGYSFVPVRFGAPPEVALITLRRTFQEPPPAAPAAVTTPAPADTAPAADTLPQ